MRGHRVEAQPVEDILQTQFGEIEVAVLDYQNEALVAFVAAPSLPYREASQRWLLLLRSGLTRVIASLAEQLPAPSVPTSIFLVEKFVMKPVSGRIDREQLPDLSRRRSAGDRTHLAGHGGRPAREAELKRSPPVEAGMSPECEEVLAICRSLFETPLGLDDGFVEAGAHSLIIARLAQRLQNRRLGGVGPGAAERPQYPAKGGGLPANVPRQPSGPLRLP